VDDGGRRCGSALLDVAAAALVEELLIENERGYVGGAVRAMLVPPASLSSLSLGEGGGEAALLKRRKMPLPLVTGVVLVTVAAASDSGRTGDDAARTISAFVGALDSDSARKVGPDASTSQTSLALSVATPGEACSQPSGSRAASDDGGSEAALVPDGSLGCKESRGTTAARACSSSRCFFFLIAKSFKDILTFGVACSDGGGGGDAAERGDEGPG